MKRYSSTNGLRYILIDIGWIIDAKIKGKNRKCFFNNGCLGVDNGDGFVIFSHKIIDSGKKIKKEWKRYHIYKIVFDNDNTFHFELKK